MDKLPTKILILACLIVIVISVFAVANPGKNSSAPTLPVFASNPTPNPSQATMVSSPDGTATLTMREKKSEGNVIYTVTLSDKDGIQKEIFIKTLPQGASLSIPFNTFSPDNKYVFLKEVNSGQTDYFVIAPSGALDISGPFREKYPDYEIADVTGWGGINLVVVNAEKKSGGRGPSFWFDVGSKSFIQLSHSF